MREGGAEIAEALPVERQQAGLERPEAAALDLFAEPGDVVEVAQRRRVEQSGVADAISPAMRPVERQARAIGPAKQAVNRNAERLALDVEQRVGERRDGVLVDATAGLDGPRAQERRDLVHRECVHAEEQITQRGDDASDAGSAGVLAVFRPADDPGVGRDLEEAGAAKSGVAVNMLDACDLRHDTPAMKRTAPANHGTDPSQSVGALLRAR
jgi:hypothetical protein